MEFYSRGRGKVDIGDREPMGHIPILGTLNRFDLIEWDFACFSKLRKIPFPTIETDPFERTKSKMRTFPHVPLLHGWYLKRGEFTPFSKGLVTAFSLKLRSFSTILQKFTLLYYAI